MVRDKVTIKLFSGLALLKFKEYRCWEFTPACFFAFSVFVVPRPSSWHRQQRDAIDLLTLSLMLNTIYDDLKRTGNTTYRAGKNTC